MRNLCVKVSLVVATMLLAGCGAEAKVEVNTKPDKPEKLEGETLASRANRQLEKQNPDLVQGELTCADVKFEVDATSRCLRTVLLDDGRLVRIGATVTIDETKGGGHFLIKIDDAAQDFGVVGKAVFEDLAKQYAAQYKTKRPTGSCPAYLAGKVGVRMRCTLVTKDGKLPVVVTVTEVDPKTFNTTYTFKAAG